MTSPMIGQWFAIITTDASSTTIEGNSASSSTSFSESSAHMPRVTLRTVEPAKLLECQSVERRCTR